MSVTETRSMLAADARETRAIPARRKGRKRHWGPYVVSLVFCLLWIFPIYWTLNTAFKPRADILTPVPEWIPIHFTLENFVNAITKENFLLNLANSVLVVGCTVALALGVGFLAAAALTRFKFPLRRVILIVILFVQMVPLTALLIPLFLAFQSLGLLNSYLGLILAYTALVLPLSIWVMRGFFLAVPAEIEEAARVDGAGTFRILRSILFPLVMPGLISTSVFAFITAWNDYIIAYVMLKDSAMYTLPVWLVSFSTMKGTDYGALMAASILFSLPAVIFFLIVQRNLVSGMSAGSVKG